MTHPLLRRSHLPSVLATVTLSMAVWFAVGMPASAHSELINSNPPADSTVVKAPTAVELMFDEPIQAQGGSIVVTLNGDTVSDASTFTTQNTTASVQLDGADEPGTYQVEYRIVAADGHPGEGQFSYQLAARGSTPSADPSGTPSTLSSPVSGADSDESTGSIVWVLGAGAIGIALVAALIAVAMRGRRGRSS
jgi:methionine-rich copper-binding protein CopC